MRLAAGAVGVSGANAQTISRSTFEYQGRLTSGGQSYTGSATFRCTLYDAESDGTVVAADGSGVLDYLVTVSDSGRVVVDFSPEDAAAETVPAVVD